MKRLRDAFNVCGYRKPVRYFLDKQLATVATSIKNDAATLPPLVHSDGQQK